MPVNADSHGNMSAGVSFLYDGGQYDPTTGCPHLLAFVAAASERSNLYCNADAALGGSRKSSGGLQPMDDVIRNAHSC